jgi:hypothetical protein
MKEESSLAQRVARLCSQPHKQLVMLSGPCGQKLRVSA